MPRRTIWRYWIVKLECKDEVPITPEEYDELRLGDLMICPTVDKHGPQQIMRIGRSGDS